MICRNVVRARVRARVRGRVRVRVRIGVHVSVRVRATGITSYDFTLNFLYQGRPDSHIQSLSPLDWEDT